MTGPMEIQDALSKTEIARRLNQIQKIGSEMEQRQAASLIKQKTTSNAGRTRRTDKTDLLIIGENKERKDKRYKQPSKSNSDDLETDRDAEDDADREHLDLKV